MFITLTGNGVAAQSDPPLSIEEKREIAHRALQRNDRVRERVNRAAFRLCRGCQQRIVGDPDGHLCAFCLRIDATRNAADAEYRRLRNKFLLLAAIGGSVIVLGLWLVRS